MSRSPFDPDFEDLPGVLPVFPLEGVLLLPGGSLPLNIFEPRYLAMVRDALSGPRTIGMAQPSNDGVEQGSAPLYRTGCAGRIVAFEETGDGRYLISLNGLIRFDIENELPLLNGYRRAAACYAPFRADLAEDSGAIDRTSLLSALGSYFESTGIQSDWETIEEAPDEQLVTSLAMACPFDPSE